MKKSALTLVGCMLAWTASAEQNFYFDIGGSLYRDEVEKGVGSGFGLRIGGGWKINEIFGIEACWDSVNTLDGDDLERELQSELAEIGVVIDINSISVDIEPIRHLSMLGTASFRLGESADLIGKMGLVHITHEIEGSIDLAIPSVPNISDSFEDSVTEAMIQLGAAFNVEGTHGFEVTLSKVFGDSADILYTSGVYRLRF